MIGRERRAEDRTREQLENPPELPNVEIIPLQDGRIMVRELDSDGKTPPAKE